MSLDIWFFFLADFLNDTFSWCIYSQNIKFDIKISLTVKVLTTLQCFFFLVDVTTVKITPICFLKISESKLSAKFVIKFVKQWRCAEGFVEYLTSDESIWNQFYSETQCYSMYNLRISASTRKNRYITDTIDLNEQDETRRDEMSERTITNETVLR